MPWSREKRCDLANCKGDCLKPKSAAPVVIFACTLALFVPFLDSTSVKLTSVVSEGLKFTYLSLFIVVSWLTAIVIGCLRRHEDALVCFLDSMGMPGLITAGIYGVKIFTGA